MQAEEDRGDLVSKLNRFFAQLAGWSFDHRWIVLAIFAGLVAGGVTLAGLARQDSSYESYFDPSDSTYLAYETFREDFGSDEVSYILYHAPGTEHGAWDLDVMRKIAQLTEALEEEAPFIYEVTSLVNAELIQGVEDGIEIQKLDDDFPETQERLLELREAYMAKKMLVGGIVSADGSHGAITVEMDRTSTDPLETIRLDPEGGDGLANLYPQATYHIIEEILARPEYAGIEFFHSGDVPLNSAYNEIATEEAGTLTGITMVVIGIMLTFFFRSVVGTLAPLVVVMVSIVFSMALIGALGWSIDMSFSGTPTLLTAIGVAHSVHILSEFRVRFAELRDRREALVQTLYLVGTPCMLTSLTTAAGFASMSFVPIKSIAHQGVYAAAGVMAAFVLSLTLLMALLSFGRKVPKEEKAGATATEDTLVVRSLTAIAEFDVRHRLAILGLFGVVLLGSAAGITNLIADSNWLEDFSEDVPLKGITARVDEVMGGTSNLIFQFDAGKPEAIKNPAALKEIERVQAIVDADPDFVRKSYSIVDILKDLNQAFHGGDPAFYKLPESRELVAQYMLLYETSGGEEAEEYVTSDYQRASLEARLRLAMTSQTAALADRVTAALEEEPLEATTMSITGIGALWIKLLDYIVSSQIQGFLIAFSVIAVMMIAVFRSFSTGLLSMVPNLLPVVLTLGVMGWLGIHLDYSKIAIAGVAMGIAVDDTIHFVSRFRYEFGMRANYREALIAAMTDVGRALLITSVALVCGFLVLLMSVLDSQALQGVLLATTIVTALVADFLLMPALALTFHPFGPEREPAQSIELREAA